jgi:hypothetical protein
MRIVSDDGVLLKEHVSTSPNTSLFVPNEPCYIVLDKHNYVPYVLYYNPTASYIQNSIIKQDTYYCGNNIIIGNNVTSAKPYGNVIVDKTSKMIVDSETKAIIKSGFTCQKGGELFIK